MSEYTELPLVEIFVDVPAAADSVGVPGQVAYDADYLYICIADDTWKRVAISTWP